MQSIQNTSIPSPEYRDLPLAQLVESPTNPRKRYDPASLEELAQSFRSRGVLEPLLVRPVEATRFEIVAGSRRFRATQLAQLETVPARIREMTDAEALEVQCIENLQREDIHPLEEAQGFRALLELPDHSYTVALISERAGKTPAYIAGRLRLTELISDVADAFLSGILTIGHAVLIAKLPPEQQYEAFKAAFKSTWMTGGQTEILVPTRELALWIESNMLLDLQTALFDRSDAGLVPDAGSCHDCTKRTGANSLLFPESAHDQCLDRDCYQKKSRRTWPSRSNITPNSFRSPRRGELTRTASSDAGSTSRLQRRLPGMATESSRRSARNARISPRR